ncbi:hypothetical protein KY284_014254 [Solanum tuberosum]|nr:hypothetical protein KY284_014254 [Solanum tuberosum]
MSLGISLQWQLPSVIRSTRTSAAQLRTTDVFLSLPTVHSGRALQYSTIPSSSIATGKRDGRLRSIRCLSALDPNLKSTLDKVVTSQKIVLFMKGTKEFPQCGFSNTVVQILKALNAPFETLNILENEALRQGLKEYSSWPTFPQLYIDGEFFGGCDIVVGRSIQERRVARVARKDIVLLIDSDDQKWDTYSHSLTGLSCGIRPLVLGYGRLENAYTTPHPFPKLCIDAVDGNKHFKS